MIMSNFTSVEQSKKFIELGLSPKSADMLYTWDTDNKTYYPLPIVDDKKHDFPSGLPCWSVGALMNLLPSKFTEKGKYYETTYNIDIRKYALTEDVDLYQIAYGNYTLYDSWKDMINTGEKENLIDAAFKMVCWLLENNKL